jgi:molybdenum cofactor biosynthesis enzyme MoaA
MGSSTVSQVSADISTPRTAERVKRLGKAARVEDQSHRATHSLPSSKACEGCYRFRLSCSGTEAGYREYGLPVRAALRTRKSSKMTGMTRYSRVEHMKRKIGDDLKALMKLRP